MVLNPFGKPLKIHNRNVVNQIKNENPSSTQIILICRQQLPPQRNYTDFFYCLNYGKLDHVAMKCKSMPKSNASPNAHANLTDEQLFLCSPKST